MGDEKLSQAKKSDIIGTVDTQSATREILSQSAAGVRLTNQMVNPKQVAKSYISTVKGTEKKLTKKADVEIKKLEIMDNAKARTDLGYNLKVNSTKNQAHKASKAVQKRDAYVSKNYRKQTVRKELVTKATDKVKTVVKTKVDSDLLCLRKEIGKTQTGSNLLCITDKAVDTAKTTIAAGNRILAPTVKSAKFVSKGTGRMVRGGASLVRQLRIKEILSAENAGVEVAKTGVLAVANLTVKLVSMIFKAIGKWLLKLLMPVVPYLVLIIVPFIIVVVGAVAVASDDNSKEEETIPSVNISNARNNVMEQAHNFIGQNGTEIWKYCNSGQCHWCCYFVSTCFGYAGASELFCDGRIVGDCGAVKDWALKNDEMIVYYHNFATGEERGDPKAGKHGDLVMYDYADNGYRNGYPNHIGFIEDYNEDNGTYTTIEGNTGGRGSDAAFYTSSKVSYYPNYLSHSDPKLFMIVRPNYDTISDSTGVVNCPESVAQWESWVIKRCIANNDPNSPTDLYKFYPAIMTIIWQESSGVSSSCNGDLMQCRESGYWVDSEMPSSWTTEQKSIDAGIRYYYDLLKYWDVRDPNDLERLKLVAQGYNYGYPFLVWCKECEIEKWTLEISTTYSNKLANQMGWKSYGHKPYGNEWISKYKSIKQ